MTSSGRQRADGTSARTNGYNGIEVAAGNSYFATTRLVGGSTAADRNLISGNGTGVMLASGGGNVVRNNFVGTTRSGNTALGNANGIYASSIGNDVSGNVVSGIISSDTPEGVSIKTADGLVRTFKADEIEEKEKQKISLMPADLQKVMSAQDLADVVSYLATLRKK